MVKKKSTMTIDENISSTELSELHTKAYETFTLWLSLNETDSFKREKKILETVQTVSAIQLEMLSKAVFGTVENHLALYWNIEDFSEFNIKEFGSISKIKGTLLMSLACRDKTAQDHYLFFKRMREKVDTIGLTGFYEDYGIIALGGYIKTLNGILSTFLVNKLSQQPFELWEAQEEPEAFSFTKEQFEWLLSQFQFLARIKEHDLDPYEAISQKVVAEIPDYKDLIRRGLNLTQRLIDDFEDEE